MERPDKSRLQKLEHALISGLVSNEPLKRKYAFRDQAEDNSAMLSRDGFLRSRGERVNGSRSTKYG